MDAIINTHAGCRSSCTKDNESCGITSNKHSCKQEIGVRDTAAHSVFEYVNYRSYHKTGISFEAVTLEKGLDIKVRESVLDATLYHKGNCCCLYKEISSSSWRA